MKKRLTLIVAFVMIFSAILPTTVSLAGSVDETALELVLEKISNMEEEDRKEGASILEMYIKYGDSGIDDLKNDLDIIDENKYKKVLGKHGYTIEDVKNELNILYEWKQSDRLRLVDYIESGNTSSIRELVKSYEKDNDTEGSGGSVLPVPVEDNNKEVEKPEEDKKEDEKENLLEVKFKDISNISAKEDIIFLAERGIIKGKTEDRYDPNGKLTRAEFVTFISRILDLESKDQKSLPFKDVKKDSWYYDAVKIAFDHKIVEGTSSTKFSPDRKVTKEQMVVIVMRILDKKDIIETLEPIEKSIEDYKDKDRISPWAKKYVANSIKYGIIKGKTETTLNPKEFANRAETAQMIKRLFDILNKSELSEVIER